jgi:hypothetical protein
MQISLTGEKSHTVNLPAGQASLSIGTKGISEGKYDVWVEKGQQINWDAFNELYTGHGKKNAEQYPYGDWPRHFYYSGVDDGFIAWSSYRRIEHFHWLPTDKTNVDLTQAQIHTLVIDVYSNEIEIIIGEKLEALSLGGYLDNITIKKCIKIPLLHFRPLCSDSKTQTHYLPVYKAIEKATHASVSVPPIGQAFDCESLLQFSDLTDLQLRGNLTNIQALAELKHLKHIALRYVPDLTDMPSLTAWNNLRSFIGWNIEETAGKAIKAELNKLSKEKDMGLTDVSQLRKKIWFTTEYGIPFSAWENKYAKIATKAYKACLKEIKKAKAESEVHKAIVEFIESMNKLPNIETPEREDIATAVDQLVESSSLEISQETGLKWFDETID